MQLVRSVDFPVTPRSQLQLVLISLWMTSELKKVRGGSIRELKQRRRRRRLQLQRRKTIGLMSKNNRIALHVRFTFWYISLPSSAKQQREMTTFKVFWRK